MPTKIRYIQGVSDVTVPNVLIEEGAWVMRPLLDSPFLLPQIDDDRGTTCLHEPDLPLFRFDPAYPFLPAPPSEEDRGLSGLEEPDIPLFGPRVADATFLITPITEEDHADSGIDDDYSLLLRMCVLEYAPPIMQWRESVLAAGPAPEVCQPTQVSIGDSLHTAAIGNSLVSAVIGLSRNSVSLGNSLTSAEIDPSANSVEITCPE